MPLSLILSGDARDTVLGAVNSCLSCQAQNGRQTSREWVIWESGMQVFPYFRNSCLRYICGNHGRGSLGIPKRSMGSVWDMVKGRQGNIKKNKCGCLVLRDTGHGKEFCVTQGHAILQGFSQNKCLFWVDGEGATLAYGGVAEGATMKTHGV